MKTTSRDAIKDSSAYPLLYKDERGHYIAYTVPFAYQELNAMCVETGIRYSIPANESQANALGFTRISSITVVE